jgi:hypothetical protein
MPSNFTHISCPSCGEPNPPVAIFCMWCGGRLPHIVADGEQSADVSPTISPPGRLLPWHKRKRKNYPLVYFGWVLETLGALVLLGSFSIAIYALRPPGYNSYYSTGDVALAAIAITITLCAFVTLIMPGYVLVKINSMGPNQDR